MPTLPVQNVSPESKMRFQELMPDVLHWLGITRIDRIWANLKTGS